ncbi:PAS domain-containing sensor histidine kinase [Pontibacter harenae]|uniref:PAS domain-containing sensor histidine kinase n=1 Tax=Pontibacter harenae TaxID=2894083 RepID=UPI001E5DE282|nr:PAS domain-containing sensor histidine kinase [Pontibacter harenae]MCC9167711.1 PAS domain-containing sensor histidine kinase [Pontibacter harenae]
MERETSVKVWEKMAQVSLDMLCTFDRNGNFTHVSSASRTILGYSPHEIEGHHFSEFTHLADLTASQEVTQKILSGTEVTNFENRFMHRCGYAVPLLWSAVWSEEDEAVFAVAHDITERKVSRSKLEESEQRYKSLFEHNPDILYVESTDGMVVEVNNSFCQILGLSEEEVVNRPASSFLPPDMVTVSDMYLQQALLGSKMRFDMELETVNRERKIFDAIKYPILVHGEVVGVKTIAKDITSVIRSYETIQQQANKLNTIFESITDAFLTLDTNWNITYINGEAERLLQLDKRYHIGKSLLKIFPEQVGGEFYTQYVQAFETGKAVNFTAYVKEFDKWFRVKAFPSSGGLSIYFDDATEMVQSRQELEKLSLVASNTINSVIIMDQDARIEWVNESFTKLTGYTLSEAAGTQPFNLLLGKETDQAVVQHVVEKINSAQPLKAEILVYRKTGEKRWFSIEVTPVFDEEGALSRWIGIQTDVTERVRADEELKKLSLVASKTSNGVIILDGEGRTEWVNDGFTRMTGYTLAEIKGKKPRELLQGPETDKDELEKITRNIKAGVSFNSVMVNYRKSGEPFWISMDVSPVFESGGKVTHTIAIQKDITFRKEAEANLLKMSQDLYQHNRDLQQFTYIISHNLRGPVANALGITRLLETIDKDSDQFNVLMTFLNESVTRLDEVLRDVNLILSIRDRQDVFGKEKVRLSDVCYQAMTDLQEPLMKCNGRVDVEVENGILVQGNRAYLYSIFHNLLSNAIKYRSEKRNLKISITGCVNSEGVAVIRISDNGSGFDVEKAGNNLFKMYKRFHLGREGKGLGLFLVKTHVEAMGGRIEVSSRVGEGTTFIIHLNEATHEDLYH